MTDRIRPYLTGDVSGRLGGTGDAHAPGRLPWVMQVHLVKGTTVQRGGDFHRVILAVGAMSEPGPDDMLHIVVRGRRIELPLVYLALLWPKPFRFYQQIHVDRAERFELFTDAPSTMAVLIGMRLE